MKTKSSLSKRTKEFATIWGELDYFCKMIHHGLYEKHDKSLAKHYENRLKCILDNLPKNDLAILREEGLALLHELKGENAKAIKHRKNEIKLMEHLHSSIQKSIEAGDIDAEMGASILSHRDGNALKKRFAILRTLENEETEPINGVMGAKFNQRKGKKD